MTALDEPPYGLGWRIGKNTYVLDGLGGLQMPRLDIVRREALHTVIRCDSAADPRSVRQLSRCWEWFRQSVQTIVPHLGRDWPPSVVGAEIRKLTAVVPPWVP